MNYSFTERKRVRKSFAKRVNNHQVPYLIATQLESYAKFLQADKPAMSRLTEGLQAAFTSAFPIVSNNGYARASPLLLRPMRSRLAKLRSVSAASSASSTALISPLSILPP